MKHLIVGAGGVGKALYNVLKKKDKTIQIRDVDETYVDKPIDVLHICFPYGASFETLVREYINEYEPSMVVIHSTVKVGTTSSLNRLAGAKIMHSPIVGQHNALEKGLLTFEKWLAPGDKKIEKYFKEAGMKVVVKDKPETTELAKLFSTFRYGLAIARAQEEEIICKQINVDFKDVSIKFLRMYNKGYKMLDMAEITQPVTTPGVIGGHCVIPNVDLLLSQYPDFRLAKLVKEDSDRRNNRHSDGGMA